MFTYFFGGSREKPEADFFINNLTKGKIGKKLEILNVGKNFKIQCR